MSERVRNNDVYGSTRRFSRRDYEKESRERRRDTIGVSRTASSTPKPVPETDRNWRPGSYCF